MEENRLFSNSHILAWLQYYSENTDVDLEQVKILDITRRNKNLIPCVEANRSVLVFTEAGHPDIFYRMFNAGLGECTVVYNEGSSPSGPVKMNKIYDMMDRGINASAAMLILNPKARSTYRFGMDNANFARGSVRYVGSEIRAVILSKMQIDPQKNICIISGESIAVEAAMLAAEGTVVAVEYNSHDRETLEDNVSHFGLNNVHIIDHVDAASWGSLPAPDVTFLVASASMEQEMQYMLQLNPAMEFVIYTLDIRVMSEMPKLCRQFGIRDPEIVQLSVSKMTPKYTFVSQPAPWIIAGKAGPA